MRGVIYAPHPNTCVNGWCFKKEIKDALGLKVNRLKVLVGKSLVEKN